MAPNGNPPHGYNTQSSPSVGDLPPTTGDSITSAGSPLADGHSASPDPAHFPTGGVNAPPGPAPYHPEVPQESTSPVEHQGQALDDAGPHGQQVEGSTLLFVPPWAWTQDTNTLGIFRNLAGEGLIDTAVVPGHLPPSRVGTQAYTALPLMTTGSPATRTSSMEGEADAQPRAPSSVSRYPPVQGQSCPAGKIEEDLLCIGDGFPSDSTQPRHDNRTFQEDLAFLQGHPFKESFVFRPAK